MPIGMRSKDDEPADLDAMLIVKHGYYILYLRHLPDRFFEVFYPSSLFEPTLKHNVSFELLSFLAELGCLSGVLPPLGN